MIGGVISAIAVMFMVVLLFLGIKIVTEKGYSATRFGLQRYDPQKDEHLQKAKKVHTKKKERLKMSLSQRVGLILSGGFFLGFVAFAVTGSGVITTISALGGFLMPLLREKRIIKSKERLYSSQVEQAMETISMVIRSGGDITEGMERAAKEVGEPFRAVLLKAVDELRLGKPEVEVFQEMAAKTPVPELEMLSIATMLKKEGLVINTTNVMSSIQHSIRERQAYTEEVRVMTTENRLAAWIVSIIPFVLIAIMRNLMPGFRETLFENALGIVFSFLMFTTIIGGVAWALNIADVEKELL